MYILKWLMHLANRLKNPNWREPDQLATYKHASLVVRAELKEARKGFKLHVRTQSTHAITKMHTSAESVLKSAYRKLMLRKIA